MIERHDWLVEVYNALPENTAEQDREKADAVINEIAELEETLIMTSPVTPQDAAELEAALFGGEDGDG